MLGPSGGRGRRTLRPLVGRGRWQIVAQVIAVRVDLGWCSVGWGLMAWSRLALGRDLPFVVARRRVLGRLAVLRRTLLRRLRRALGCLGHVGERGRCGRISWWISQRRGLRRSACRRRIVGRRIGRKARIGALVLRVGLVSLGGRRGASRGLHALRGLRRVGLGWRCCRRVGLRRILRRLGCVLRLRDVLLRGLRRRGRLPVLAVGLLAGLLGRRRIGLTVNRRLLPQR